MVIRLLVVCDFDTVHQKIKFTMKKGAQNKINYLQLTITNKHNQLTFGADHGSRAV